MNANPQGAVLPANQPPQPPPADHLMRVATGLFASSALNAAIRLGIADDLAAGPKTAKELAPRRGVHADSLHRLLRALASLGIFAEVGEGRFANSPASDVLRADAPGSARDMALFVTDAFHFEMYADMLPAVKDGRTICEHKRGKNIFDVFAGDPAEQTLFNNAMTSFSASAMPAILEAYDFGGIGTLVDVAGGHGFLLTSVLAKHPQMRGVLFDLEHVVPGARARIESLGLGARCTTVSGDFFASVPAGDAYVMKHIIHDWDDQRALSILENCRRAMQGNGKVILLEAILSPPNAPHMSKLLDLEMLMLPGGRERTEAEYAALFARAGLKLTRVVPTKSPLSVLEAVKA